MRLDSLQNSSNSPITYGMSLPACQFSILPHSVVSFFSYYHTLFSDLFDGDVDVGDVVTVEGPKSQKDVEKVKTPHVYI